MVSRTARLHNFLTGSHHPAEDANHTLYSPSRSSSHTSVNEDSRPSISRLIRRSDMGDGSAPGSTNTSRPGSGQGALPGSDTFSSAPVSSYRPTLDEILSGQSLFPFTLPALVAYMSSNHCLETLEFTMDASRYGQHYDRAMRKHPDQTTRDARRDLEYVSNLWSLLVATYVARNGRREVNLPSAVRDQILGAASRVGTGIPPSPTVLSSAVRLTNELISESVLVNFFNSVVGTASSQAPTSQPSFPRSTRDGHEGRQSPTSQGREGIMTPPTTPPQCQLGTPPPDPDSIHLSEGSSSRATSVSTHSPPPKTSRLGRSGSNAGSSTPATLSASDTSSAIQKPEGTWRKMSRNLGLRK